jgi:hypothetical protein
LNLRTIRLLGLGSVLCLLALPLAAAPTSGVISGVVVDQNGTPQMGATVLVSSQQVFSASTIKLLTNEQGRFATVSLAQGAYSVKVTLAGFLPAMEQGVKVDAQHITLVEIVLGSVFSSFEKLRRQPDQQLSADDWSWVLRASAGLRPVLQWSDGSISTSAPANHRETAAESDHGRVELSSGSDQPGSVVNPGDSPSTTFVYDMGIGPQAQLLMAGQFSYDGIFSGEALGAEWLPSGKQGVGPETTLVVRESKLSPNSPAFRGLRISHEDQLALSDRLTVRYGGEYVVAGLSQTTSALRPRAEIALKLSPTWEASASYITRPWQDNTASPEAAESALGALDTFPTLMVRGSRPVLADDKHEEFAIGHAIGSRANVTAAVFHDRSSHTAVIGRGTTSAPDFLQAYYSEAFAYDGGASQSGGARVAYEQKLGDKFKGALVYAYAGALSPNGKSSELRLRQELETEYRHSVAARVSTTVPRLGTRLSAGYKWLSGPAVSQQDPYGESIYRIDPYLSMEVTQPLPRSFPCHMEVKADVGNLLAQGYVPVATSRDSVVLVPSYRYFKGGLSLQF